MVKKKMVIVCDKCGSILEPIKNLEDLESLPYEWYVDKNLFLKYEIYDCKDCHIMFRIRKPYYHINIIRDIFRWIINQIKKVW